MTPYPRRPTDALATRSAHVQRRWWRRPAFRIGAGVFDPPVRARVLADGQAAAAPRPDRAAVTDADRYAFAFKRLPQWTIARLEYPRRVFYGQLAGTLARVSDTGGEFRIPLHAGEWDSDQKRFARTWELRLDHSAWSRRGRAALLNELECAVAQARDEGKQPWFFALASQHPNELAAIEDVRPPLGGVFPADRRGGGAPGWRGEPACGGPGQRVKTQRLGVVLP